MAKLLFKPIYAEELQDSEKDSTIWVKNLSKIVNKINNTKSSMIDMKPKDAIKLDTVPLDKTYPEETALPEDGLYRYLYQPGEQHGDQKKTGNRLYLEQKYVSIRSNCTRTRQSCPVLFTGWTQ